MFEDHSRPEPWVTGEFGRGSKPIEQLTQIDLVGNAMYSRLAGSLSMRDDDSWKESNEVKPGRGPIHQ